MSEVRDCRSCAHYRMTLYALELCHAPQVINRPQKPLSFEEKVRGPHPNRSSAWVYGERDDRWKDGIERCGSEGKFWQQRLTFIQKIAAWFRR